MKQILKAAKLLFMLFVFGVIALLITMVNQPEKRASAVACDAIGVSDCVLDQPITNIDPCQTQNPPAGCDQTRCTDPDVDGCLPGCSLNSDEVCVPDQPTIPTTSNDPPPQVLAASTTATTPGGK